MAPRQNNPNGRSKAELRDYPKRLEGQIEILTGMLEHVRGLLNAERSLREQLQLVEVMGRTAVRLGELWRLQQLIAIHEAEVNQAGSADEALHRLVEEISEEKLKERMAARGIALPPPLTPEEKDRMGIVHAESPGLRSVPPG